MRSARVTAVRESCKGVTRPLRLTLSDGTTTHDASFQAVDERKAGDEGRQRPDRNQFRATRGATTSPPIVLPTDWGWRT